MGGDVPSNTTTKTTTELPAYIQPYAVKLMGDAANLSNRGYTPYKGQQVAPLTALHNQGIDMVQKNAANPLTASAENLVSNTLGGKYLSQGNPYLNQVINQSNQDITNAFRNSTMPQTDATFARSGAFGGSAWQQANAENNRQLASELAKNTSNLRYQDYGTERQNQINAIGQAGDLARQRYTDAQNLLGAGDIQRDYNQTMNTLGYQNYLNQQNWPLQNLDILGNAISRLQGGGGSSIQQTPMAQVNRTASMIGGGLAGGMAGGMLGNQLGGMAGQYGGAAGAGLGALAGLFG